MVTPEGKLKVSYCLITHMPLKDMKMVFLVDENINFKDT